MNYDLIDIKVVYKEFLFTPVKVDEIFKKEEFEVEKEEIVTQKNETSEVVLLPIIKELTKTNKKSLFDSKFLSFLEK